jgi:hypothetical protein
VAWPFTVEKFGVYGVTFDVPPPLVIRYVVFGPGKGGKNVPGGNGGTVGSMMQLFASNVERKFP